MERFTWYPRPGMGIKTKPLVKVVKFGDGYEQRTPSGLNVQLSTYNVTFRVTKDEGGTLRGFLSRHGGYKAFLWQPPDSKVEIKVVCREWDIKIQEVYMEISCRFEEVVA